MNLNVFLSYFVEFLTIVGYMDRPSLFFSAESLLESLQKVTPYCVITGTMKCEL